MTNHNPPQKPAIQSLIEVMARLRDPDHGCPWDLKQTIQSITPYTLEEVYEVVEAAEQGDMTALRDELGDLLFHVVYYAQLAHETQHFDFDAIARHASEKMIRRHPHVFADDANNSDSPSLEQLHQNWEKQKTEERQEKKTADNASFENPSSVFDGINRRLPALSHAIKLQKRVAQVGFDWPDIDQVFDKVCEEVDEVKAELHNTADPKRLRHEIGDLMLAVSNLARHAQLDPEATLREANHRFEHRFRQIETQVHTQSLDIATLSLETLEALWQQIKDNEADQ